MFSSKKKLSKATSSSGGTGSSSALSPISHLSSAPFCLTDGQPLPKMIVFDLDYTLWPFWVDTHVTPPLRINAQHTVAADRTGETFSFYPEVPEILWALPLTGIKMGVASRTHAPDLGREMLKLLHIPIPEDVIAAGASSGKKDKPKKGLEVFEYMEIYPSSKIRHLEALQRKTGIDYRDTLFFDDESRNRETESLGVTFWLVRDGLDWNEIEKGILQWRQNRNRAS